MKSTSCSMPNRMSLLVLLGDRRQVHAHAGQVDVLARAELAAVEHAAAQACSRDLEHLEVDQAVVDGDAVADLEVLDHVLVVDVDALLFGVLLRADRERERLADLEIDACLAISPVRISGPLQVEQHRDRVVELAVEALDAPDAEQVPTRGRRATC